MLYRFVLFPVTLSDPNVIPQINQFLTFCIAFDIFLLSGLRDKQVLASQALQIIPGRGVVWSCKPFKFCWWAPTISLERLIVLGAVNLVRR